MKVHYKLQISQTMNIINKKQANWIADLIEKGHIHYEMRDSFFGNIFFKDGYFIEEQDNRQEKKRKTMQYSRNEFIRLVMSSPRQRYSRFLDSIN
jgi:serine protease inhibitor